MTDQSRSSGDGSTSERARQVTILASDFGGGTGNHLLEMTRYWDRTLWNVQIISEAQQTARYAASVPVTQLSRPVHLDCYPFTQTYRFAQLVRSVRLRPPDIIHSYFFWSIMYGRALKRLGLVKVLVENREDEGFNWGRHEYALLRLTRSLPDRVICVSKGVRRVVLQREKLDPGRVTVIHNGIVPVGHCARDGVEEARTRLSIGVGPEEPVVGMVANFNRAIKGTPYLLEAIPYIVHDFPSARFVLLGRGEAERNLRALARRLGIEDKLIFAGFREDVARFYSIMDVSVLTSLSEGLSITLLESMNHGLPVVATRVGGNPELVVEGETGFLVPPRDVEAFAERVVLLLRDRSLRERMGQAGRRRVSEHFRLEQAARAYLSVYAELLSATPSSSRQRSI